MPSVMITGASGFVGTRLMTGLAASGMTVVGTTRTDAPPPHHDRRLLRVLGRQPVFSLCSVENAADAVRHALRDRLEPGVYNVADQDVYSQEAVRDTIARLDRRRLTLPVPQLLASVAIGIGSRFLPKRIGDLLRANYAKLFVGSTPDTTRIRRAGFLPRHQLKQFS